MRNKNKTVIFFHPLSIRRKRRHLRQKQNLGNAVLPTGKVPNKEIKKYNTMKLKIKLDLMSSFSKGSNQYKRNTAKTSYRGKTYFKRHSTIPKLKCT